jgi:alpha-amylase
MVADVALYLLVHQPRRLKLPAQPIPRCASIEDITHCLFDERLNEQYFRQVARSSYYPATRMLLDLVRRRGLHLALGLSLSFTRQADLWEPELLDLFRELIAEEHVELIGVDPYHSLHCLIDLPNFAMRMRWMADELEHTFGKRPTVMHTTEMCMSSSIYAALDTAGFRGALVDGTPQIMQWRSSNYLYRSSDHERCAVPVKIPTRTRRSTARISERDRLGPPYTASVPGESGPFLLPRHIGLSEDLATRFSDHNWASYPLYADSYAKWIARSEGDFVLLGLDFETLGEHHSHSSGIFEFMQALPDELEQHGIATRTPGELIDRFSQQDTYHLPLPIYPTNWSHSDNADAHSTFFDYEPQKALFQLMHDVYSLARLTEHPELLDLAIWLTQSDNLNLVQWPGPQIAYGVTPHEWWSLGASRLLQEQRQVFINLLYAIEPYLPVRAIRQTRQKAPNKALRSQIAIEAEFRIMARRH